MAIRVFVVDDHEIMREGLCDLLGMTEDMEVVGEAEDGLTALKRVEELCPDVVIMDIEMPNLNGIEATRQMMKRHPRLKILALSAHSEADIVTQMINAGAQGYMHKESTFSEVKEGVKTILEGQPFLCSRISKVIISKYFMMMSNPNLVEADGLSRQQCRILQLIAEGHSIKEIAAILKVCQKTIEAHREHIRNKLGVHTVPELTKYAIHKGLVTL